MHRDPAAWLVVSHDGAHRAVFLDVKRAERWAPDCCGTVHALYLWPEPPPEGGPGQKKRRPKQLHRDATAPMGQLKGSP